MPALLGDARRVGFEASRLTYAHWAILEAAARERSSSLVPTTNLVEDVRARKSPDEIELIRAGAEINDRVYEWLASEGLDGRSERDWVVAIAERMRELGADGPAFDSIVAVGRERRGAARGARLRRVIERNTLVVLDIGALVERLLLRLHADVRDRSHRRRDARGVRGRAARAGGGARARAARHPVHRGARDRATRDRRGGYGEYFNHGTGHGVGVEMHEEPRFRTGFGGRPRAG